MTTLASQKAKNLQKIAQNTRKCGFGCQDDVIGTKNGKIFENKLFQTNLFSTVNNLHHGFVG